MARSYSYVGPPEIAAAADMTAPRAKVSNADDVRAWVDESSQDLDGNGSFTATFIVDIDRQLWIADRRSEHVACARGATVLSAGEITFTVSARDVDAVYLTNQSTGYCPEPESWSAVANSLDSAGIGHPNSFDVQCIFRRCTCGQINIVKNSDYTCAVCDSQLAPKWNFNSDSAT